MPTPPRPVPAPPNSYADALAKLNAGLLPASPDLDPHYTGTDGVPPDSYAIALAIRRVMEEEEHKK